MLFSNPFKQREPEQKQGPASETKDIDQSQDYMKAMLAAQKTDPVKEKQEQPDKASMSTRFSQGLSYTKAAEQKSKSPECSKDVDRD